MPNRETVRRMEPRGAVETTSTLNFTPHTRKEQFPADLWDGWRTAVGLNPRPIDFSRGGLTLTAPGQKVGQISLLGAPRPDRVLHNGRNVEGSDGRHKRFIVAIPDEIDVFTADLWDNLNEKNRISLYVRYIDLATGKAESRMINKYNG